MGVQSLWDLLGPTGSRLEIQALSGKRVAVDASIWLVQFFKAMRDERGEVVPNAHLLGFFRRIVRLLCNRIRPVFVFDGETPAMKRQTVAARRRQRAQADVKLKRVAEKLLLSHVKQHLAAKNAGNSGPGPSSGAAAADVPIVPPGAGMVTDAEVADELEPTCRVVPYDEVNVIGDDDDEAEPKESEEDDDGDMTALELPVLADGESYDVSVLAALPTSLQLQLIARMRDQRSAANRVKLQAASARAPGAFSSAQLEAYIANGKVKRQLDSLIRAPPITGLPAAVDDDAPPGTVRNDSMRAQRIAGDAACEFVFTGMEDRGYDPLDEIAALRKRGSVIPVKMPAGRPVMRLGAGPLHTILPPPLPGTLRSAQISPAEAAIVMPQPESSLPEEPDLAISFEVPVDDADADAQMDDEEEWEDVDAPGTDIMPAVVHHPPPRSIAPPPPPPPSVADILRVVSDEDKPTSPGIAMAPGAAQAGGDADAALVQLSRRQLYARSHGFLLGRNLNDWAQEDEVVPLLNPGHTSADEDGEGDGDLALAIARSLEDGSGDHARTPATGPSDGPDVIILDDDEGPQVEDRADAPAMIVSCHDGRTWPLTWAAFSACVDAVQREWPPWLPMPDVLDTQPVRIIHVGTGAEWLVDTPVLDSLTRIRREASAQSTQHVQERALNARVVAPPAQQQQKQPQGGANGKAKVMFAAPEEAHVNGQPVAWDARWEGAAAEYRPPPGGGNGGTGAGPSWHTHEAVAAEALHREEEFEAERAALRAEQRAASKAADTVTPEMYVEVQELLTMFGIPFIIAPFEAEAQCAWLEEAGLVDAVVTDDSDVFLFGAKTVCRNIFEARKFVELYTADAIQQRLGLTREHLAWLALLLGSDYTPGVTGVGIVHAAEIVAAFPGMDGLRRFKAWVEAPESDLAAELLGKQPKKARGGVRGNKAQAPDKGGAGDNADAALVIDDSDDDTPAQPAAEDGAAEEEEDSPATLEFKRRHASARKTFVLSEGFPSQAVVDAYLRPQVDSSRERFEWGAPDELLLRHFCTQRLGWPPDRTEPVLADVMRQAALRDTQRTVTSFFRPQDGEAFAKVRSKRLYKAIAQLTGREDPSLALPPDQDAPAPAKKPKAKRKRKQQDEGVAEDGAPARRLAPGQRVTQDGTVVEPSGFGFDIAVPGSDF